jgi:protein SCO1/2
MKHASKPLHDLAEVLNQVAPGYGECRAGSELFALMREDAWIYQGRASSEVERLRAFIAVKLAEAGYTDTLVPFAIEELETGTDPYAIAAAARVVRAAASLPPDIVDLITSAIDRIRSRNEFVRFDRYPLGTGQGPVTAVDEAREALSVVRSKSGAMVETAVRPELGGAIQPCCTSMSDTVQSPGAGSIVGLHHVELENQDGQRTTVGDLFANRRALVVFFYTRCMNPDKCSRTVSQLAEVRSLISGRGALGSVLLAGITYDPGYDNSERLHRYGADRGLTFDDHCQLLRSIGPFEPIRDSLQLGVGYGASTVNRHRIELLVIDANGFIVHSNERRLWAADDVADMLLAS